MKLVYFIILIGVLIFFHELGHFLAAKAFGVKVLKFALGFGRSLVSFRWKETVYAINWFPLGGYVKMLGQEPVELRGEEPGSDEDRNRAFDHKPRWQRFLIILAGPVFNLILPLPIYFLFFATQTTLPPAMVGSVIPGSPAWEAGLKPGDSIVAIDGESIRYWEDMEDRINDAPGRTLTFQVLRRGGPLTLEVTPEARVVPNRIKALSRTVGLIGVTQVFLGTQVGVLGQHTVAGQAGLQTWDVVVEAGGQKVHKWVELEDIVARNAGRPLQLVVQRADLEALRRQPDPEQAVEEEEQQVPARELTLQLDVPPAGTLSAAGIDSGEFFIFRLEPEGAAQRAGLRVGDRVLSVDGEQCATFDLCFRHFREEPEQDHRVTFLRPEPPLVPRELTFQADVEKKLNEVKQEEVHARIGLANHSRLIRTEAVPNEQRWSRAFFGSFSQNWTMIRLNVVGLGLLVTGQIPASTVGGPIMIFDLTQKAAQRGWEDFLWLLAVISINLGLINLLPIPMLDGGQLVFIGIETILRSPLSLKARSIAAYVGLTLIVLLMIFAFKNDIERYWVDIKGFVGVSDEPEP